MSSLEELVRQELEDPDYLHRPHGTRRCYRAGCRGPLCKRFIRQQRREYRGSGPGYQEELDKILEPYQEKHDEELARRKEVDCARAG